MTTSCEEALIIIPGHLTKNLSGGRGIAYSADEGRAILSMNDNDEIDPQNLRRFLFPFGPARFLDFVHTVVVPDSIHVLSHSDTIQQS